MDVGLVGRLANILPSPVLESDGKLDGAIDHRIIVCTLCRDVPTGTRSGESLCANLRSRLSAHHEPAVAHGFTIEGVECMAGCARPLTVAFQAPGKAAAHSTHASRHGMDPRRAYSVTATTQLGR